MSIDTDEVTFAREGQLGLITLNRPKALNALTLPMVRSIADILALWREDDEIGRLLIRAVEGRAFCAGGDIRAVWRTAKDKSVQEAARFLWHEYQMNWRIAELPKPYIALLDGITMGGGAGLSVHGDIRIVTERTKFAMPETGIGFFPDVGGSYFLSRLPFNAGVYLGLTGTTIGPRASLAFGIATHAVKSEDLTSVAATLREAGNASDALMEFGSADLSADTEPDLEAIERLFQPDSVAAIFQRLERDSSEFAQETLALLRTRSPLSVCVVLEQLKRGREMTLRGCLTMEFAMVNRFLERSDFHEGVRAALVDKDRQPRWAHAEVNDVSPEEVAWYFASSSVDPPRFDWEPVVDTPE